MNYIPILDIEELGVGNSFLHKLFPINKLLMLIILYLIIFSFGIIVNMVILSFIIIILLFSNFKMRKLFNLFIFLLIPLSSFGVLVILLNVDHKLIVLLTIFIRLLSMVLPLILYSNITTLKETVYTITTIIKPLKYLKININLIVLGLFI